MPVYQYACTECGEQLEVRQSFTDDALTVCPVCEGRLRKVLSAVGVVFKGPASTAPTAARPRLVERVRRVRRFVRRVVVRAKESSGSKPPRSRPDKASGTKESPGEGVGQQRERLEQRFLKSTSVNLHVRCGVEGSRLQLSAAGLWTNAARRGRSRLLAWRP